jgi:serine/arginine repetitive matrix protein 2
MEASPPAPTFLPFLPPSPSPSPTSLPPVAPAPPAPPPAPAPAPTVTLRRASEDKDNEADVDEPNHTSSGSEDDTKQSFDFTGELRRLNESGGAHRRSFVEQLENAFKTPSRLGAEALGFELGGFLSVGVGDDWDAGREREHEDPAKDEGDKRDVEPDISMMVESLNESLNLLRPQTSVTSKPSYGRLDTAFKFGGKPQSLPDAVDTVLFYAADSHPFLLIMLPVG